MKFLLVSFAFIAACSAAVLSPDQPIPIVSQVQDLDPDGKYSFRFETANGIVVEETGEGGHFARGSVAWNSPEGLPHHLSYIADENGYQPQGDFLPVEPPVPEAIVRALDWISAHPPKEEHGAKRFKRNSPMLLGAKRCTWGPGYWCKSQANADECNAQQHCIEKVWVDGKPPAAEE